MKNSPPSGSPGFSRIERDSKALPQSKKDFQDWWIHLWSGLVRDPSGKHYENIGPAIWLYLYFLLAANWRTGTLFRRIYTIVEETGFSRRSVERWLRTLRQSGYIKTKSNGRHLDISITKWRPVSRKQTGRTDTNV